MQQERKQLISRGRKVVIIEIISGGRDNIEEDMLWRALINFLSYSVHDSRRRINSYHQILSIVRTIGLYSVFFMSKHAAVTALTQMRELSVSFQLS